MTNSAMTTVDMDSVKQLVEDLRVARPIIFFTDLTLSAGFGWAFLAISALPGLPGSGRIAAFIVGVLLLYRGIAFIHELFHQQGMKGFRFYWHVAVGIPLLIPFLLYLPIHQAHHNSKTYGTKDDGEYDQFQGRAAWQSLKLCLLNLALPVALLVRFGILTPLSVVLPVVRKEVIPNFVHMALRMPYRAPAIKESMRVEAYWVEVACTAIVVALVTAVLTGYWQLFLLWYVLVCAIAMLNTIRAVCSTHLYVEQLGGRGAAGQLEDSLNINSASWLTQVVCPVGLRFHALHHIAPYLPYHALAAAHNRLLVKLPAGSAYHVSTVPSLRQGWLRLLKATSPEPRRLEGS